MKFENNVRVATNAFQPDKWNGQDTQTVVSLIPCALQVNSVDQWLTATHLNGTRSAVNERILVTDCIHAQSGVGLLWPQVCSWQLREPDATHLKT